MEYKYDIAVVIITYNSSKYLRDAVDSILKTTFKGRLLIYFSDDASSDNTVEIIKDYKEKYPDLVDYRVNPENLGIAGNAFTAYEQVDAKYIFPVAGDDLYPNAEFLEKSFEIMEANEQLSVSYFSGEKFYENDVSTAKDYVFIPEKNEFDIRYWMNNGFFTVNLHAMLMRRTCLPKKFAPWMLKSENEDWLMLVLLLTKGNIRFTNEKATLYRIHKRGYTASGETSVKILRGMELIDNINKHTNNKYKKEFGSNGWRYERLSYAYIREKKLFRAIGNGFYYLFFGRSPFAEKINFVKSWIKYLFKGRIPSV